LKLADERQDIRERSVVDRDGQNIGHVSDIFLDTGERKIRVLEIHAIGYFRGAERHALLPVDAITSITDDAIHIDVSHRHLVQSPAYNPRLLMPPITGAWEIFYGYYGLPPYWGNGYLYPAFF
jgi:uncharacterized protein YrrD